MRSQGQSRCRSLFARRTRGISPMLAYSSGLSPMQVMEQSHQFVELSVVAQFAREASIELNVQDLKDLEASRSFLSPGKRMYISHLPKQRWDETLTACAKVSAAGFDPIPHIPVRLIENEAALAH